MTILICFIVGATIAAVFPIRYLGKVVKLYFIYAFRCYALFMADNVRDDLKERLLLKYGKGLLFASLKLAGLILSIGLAAFGFFKIYPQAMMTLVSWLEAIFLVIGTVVGWRVRLFFGR
tara:strand:+ start:1121 stop:1477 length:357 start_codon:yes stop_codon:yes gene_type:complete